LVISSGAVMRLVGSSMAIVNVDDSLTTAALAVFVCGLLWCCLWHTPETLLHMHNAIDVYVIQLSRVV